MSSELEEKKAKLAELKRKKLEILKSNQGGGFGAGLARSFNQGLYFGFADEIEAAANAALAGIRGEDITKSYDENLRAIRGQRASFAEENPGTAFAAEALGSVGTGAAGGIKLASKLPGAAGTFTRGAVVGAPAGALAGTGMADPDPNLSFMESMNERVTGGATGAGLGMLFGGTVGKVSPYIGSAVEKTVSSARGAFVGAQSKALRQIGQAIERDSKTIESLMRKKAVMGPEAGIADIGGTNMMDLLDTIANQPGRAKDRVQRALIGRLQGSRQRLKDSIRGLVHPDADNLASARQQIENNLRTQAAPLYDQAYRTPIQVTDTIKGILDRPKIKPLVNKAIQMAKSDTDLPEDLLAGIDPENPNVVLLDYVKRAIDDRVLKTKGNEQRIFRNAADKLRSAVDDQVDSYRQARQIYGSEAGRLEALEMGQNVFREAKKGVDVEKAFNSMTAEQKEMFRLGASNEMFRIMDNIPDTIEGRPGASLISKLYSSPAQKKTVDMLMETPQAARNFKRSLEAERSFFKSANKVLGNSATARRLANEADSALDVSEAAELSTGSIAGIIRAGSRILKGKGPDEATRSQLGKLLTETDPDAIRSTLRNAQMQGSLLPENIRNALDMSDNQFLRFLRNNPNAVLDQLSITTGTLVGDEL